MTVLTTRPNQEAIHKGEELVHHLRTHLQNLWARPIWDEPEIERTAADLAAFEYICDPSHDYYNLNHFLHDCRGALAWSDDDRLEFYPLTPSAWEPEQRQAFNREYHPFMNPHLPSSWYLHRMKEYPNGPLIGQELVDLLHSELGGCHNPPGCLKSVGRKRALERRWALDHYLFDAGYITNQQLLEGTEEDYLRCFFKMKAADKAAREAGITKSFGY